MLFILLAFAIGFFPETALSWLGAQARKWIFNMGPSSSYLDIEEIEGIDSYTRARLSELGILDAPRLATCNPLTLRSGRLIRCNRSSTGSVRLSFCSFSRRCVQ